MTMVGSRNQLPPLGGTRFFALSGAERGVHMVIYAYILLYILLGAKVTKVSTVAMATIEWVGYFSYYDTGGYHLRRPLRGPRPRRSTFVAFVVGESLHDKARIK